MVLWLLNLSLLFPPAILLHDSSEQIKKDRVSLCRPPKIKILLLTIKNIVILYIESRVVIKFLLR